MLQTTLGSNQRCPERFEAIIGQIEKLHQDFREFEEYQSEFCQLLGVWRQLVAIVNNPMFSEREGNWNLLFATVEDSMPAFAECDYSSYLR